ncbi:hypothetical protein LEP1GSC034_3123 [Leptospira interrogans str. 2003000735]|uniref:Uncharacterized protein n=8 Tax=Leptospira interrogans TaxID=173 RepID=M3HLG3_LEPIR|nr:hypothetical protein G436_1441 [Leptospira interrogans serovar Hardjo str. Norma]EJP05467.1 hypothetical protein LEP1GSC007_1249 [Leptospira interrogans serovar Bulgarica str. Mallika]EJP17027.1 hypothetical protein LEP1GSC080_2413 [Leptospira interrogans str. FPW2026]EKN86034.1 hypothetical protein LEP1GSC027_2668 [Leptospira interrogans str. 2002000624]EKO05479.1 hypothetical protein LEP1GSC077_3342 [Leptospira interrogans str. C10069]EKO25994.1 hypothetical protein LEP1GSC104_1629 [Lepto
MNRISALVTEFRYFIILVLNRIELLKNEFSILFLFHEIFD